MAEERFYTPPRWGRTTEDRQRERNQRWRDDQAEARRGYLADIAMDGPDGDDDDADE